MTNLTPELNLVQGELDDDTADYLTVGLASSLNILDGMFNATTGHSHNGAHQGGALEFQDLIVGEDLTVQGSLTVSGSATFSGTLTAANMVDPRLTGQTFNVNGGHTLHPVASSAGMWRFLKALGTTWVNKAGADPAGCVWGPGAITGADGFQLGNGDSVNLFCNGASWVVY